MTRIGICSPLRAIEDQANTLLVDFLKKFDLHSGKVIITRGGRERANTLEISSPGQFLPVRWKEFLQC